jgi:hypothetical protein
MSNDDQLDEQLRRLARRSIEHRASAVDTDAALSDHHGRLDSSLSPKRTRHRWFAAAAAVTMAVAGVAALAWPRSDTDPVRVATETVALPSIPTDSGSPSTEPSPTASTQPSTSAGATSTAPSTTAVPNDFTVTPTPLALFSILDGYDLDYAVTAPGGGIRLVRYRDDQPDSPAIELILRGTGDDFLNPVRELDRQTWTVNGRTVYDDNEFAGCLPDYCSVGLQWDDNTSVSVAWSAPEGTELGPEHSIESLVGFVSDLGETDPEVFRPVVVSSGPTISAHGVLLASPDGVVAFDGWERQPRVLTTMPAIKAIGLPDGRVLVQTNFSVEPSGLFVVDPNDAPQTPPAPYWPSAIPADGTVSIDVEDAATINGVPTLLLQVKNPDNGTLELASIDASNEDRRVIAEFPDASLGFLPKGFLDVDLRDTESIPAIGGITYNGFEPEVFFSDLNGQRDQRFEQQSAMGPNVRAVGLDPNVFLVSKAVGGPIRIIDQVGDQFVEIDIRDPALANEVDGSLEIEPQLLRTFPVSGSVWVQGSNPEGVIEWIEVGVDGIGRNRVTATTLTTTNR